MNDDKLLKDLFAGFEPQLSDSDTFIDRLSSRLDSVEMVRQRNAACSRFNRRSALIAACAGFVVGVVFTLLMPLLLGFFEKISGRVLDAATLIETDLPRILTWITIALMSVIAALSAYQVSLSVRIARFDS